MDRTDRQILNLLHRDGRMANVEIARRIGVSEGTVRKRIDRLMADGLLNIRGLVHPEDVGYATRALVLINVELPHLERISELLCQMREVLSVRWLTGCYDLAVEVVFDRNGELMSFLNERVGRSSHRDGSRHARGQTCRRVDYAHQYRAKGSRGGR